MLRSLKMAGLFLGVLVTLCVRGLLLWIAIPLSTATPVIERHAESLDSNLGLTITGTGLASTVSLSVVDLHGDAVSQIDLPASGDATGLSSWSDTDEYGNPLVASSVGTTPTNTDGASAGLGYGWLGGEQRATDTTGFMLMGARVYNPASGAFTSTDPVFGGNTTSHAYPQDPVDQFDLDGHWCSFGVGTTCTRFVTDRYGRSVPIRHSKRYKYERHNLTLTVVKYAIRHGKQVESSGSSVVYEYRFHQARCTGAMLSRKCERTGETEIVRVVVDVREYGLDGKTLGLVTAYCKSADPCDDWVRKSF